MFIKIDEDSSISVSRRPDLEDANGVPVFTYSIADDTCEKDYLSYDDFVAAVKEDFDIIPLARMQFQYIYSDENYAKFGDLIFENDYDDHFELVIVDSNVGLAKLIYVSDETTYAYQYQYKFYSSIPSDYYALDGGDEPGCDDDAYITPKYDPCNAPSSSAVSSSATSSSAHSSSSNIPVFSSSSSTTPAGTSSASSSNSETSSPTSASTSTKASSAKDMSSASSTFVSVALLLVMAILALF